MSITGITGYGVFIPILRLNRAAIAAAHAWHAPGLKRLAKGVRAIANWDEDAVTLAVEAARGCVAHAPETMILASTSLPFVDRQNSGIVKEALALADDILTIDITGSQRAGTSALLTALRAGPALCIAAEKHRPQPGSESDLTTADAAAAIATGNDNVIAELVASHSVSVDFVDHFRAADAEFSYGWEARWIRDEGYGKIMPATIKTLLEEANVEPSAIDHFAFGSPNHGVATTVAKILGIATDALDETLTRDVGDAGAAQPLLLLANSLETATPGQLILVAGFGQGCDAMLFRTTEEILKYQSTHRVADAVQRAEVTSDYLRYLALAQLINVDRGMRAEHTFKTPLTALYRNRKAVMGLIGGRCTKTGTVQFPKSDLSVNQNDPSFQTQEDYRFADIPAKIVTHTADRLAYTPSPPYYYGTIDFEGGGRMVAEFTDCEQDNLEVGADVKMMFRVKKRDEDRKFTQYFWKAVPAVRD